MTTAATLTEILETAKDVGYAPTAEKYNLTVQGVYQLCKSNKVKINKRNIRIRNLKRDGYSNKELSSRFRISVASIVTLTRGVTQRQKFVLTDEMKKCLETEGYEKAMEKYGKYYAFWVNIVKVNELNVYKMPRGRARNVEMINKVIELYNANTKIPEIAKAVGKCENYIYFIVRKLKKENVLKERISDAFTPMTTIPENKWVIVYSKDNRPYIGEYKKEEGRWMIDGHESFANFIGWRNCP